jgi:ribosomal protein S18 acetylase RimI-like enzyme
LRPAKEADLELLCELMGENYAEAGYGFDRAAARECFEALVRDPSLGRAWLVCEGGEVAGYAVLTLGFSLEYRGLDAFVDDLYLRPAWRGRGLGGAALESVEATARSLGVRALHLEVERSNAAGQALYRRRGFRDNDRRLLTKLLGPQGS